MMNFNLAMRNLLTGMASLFFAFAVSTAGAQCPSSGVTLATQAEVNAFGVNYPNCTTINGTLFIGVSSGTSDITDLSPLANLTTVVNLLVIYNNQNLTTLNGLNNVTSVGENLQMFGNSALTNLNGISNLATIGGNLLIDNNSALADINGLSHITSLGGNLTIDNNDALTNVSGLNNIPSIGGYLLVANNATLNNLSGLSSLTSIGKNVYIGNNAVLSDISALQNATFQPNGNDGLYVKDNPALSLCNLPSFCTYLANPAGTHPRVISGNATTCATEQDVVTACQAPTPCPTSDVTLATQAEVNAFGVNYPNCTVIEGALFLGSDNTPTDIINLGPLGNISKVTGNLDVTNCPQLQSLTGLSNLDTIGGAFNIGFNTALVSLSALSSLTSIGNDIYIIENASLTDISALQHTTFQPANNYGLTLRNNPQLSFCNLPNFCAYIANDPTTHPRVISGNATTCATEQDVVTACQAPTPCPTGDVTLATQAEVNAFGTNHNTCSTISGNLFIGATSGTSDITDLTPLAGIQTVSGYLWVANNSGLQNLNGLHNISNVGGALNITGNATIQNLNPLSGLAAVGQDIYVVQNSVLTDISALQNTTFVPISGFGLTFRDNTLLEVCNYPNFCAYIANDPTTHPRVISGNATTCATEQALQAACLTIGINDVDKAVVNTYPNPVKDVLNISAEQAITEVAVTNMLGQTVIAKTVNAATTQVDMAALPAGNYFVKVTTANGTQVGKVTKQ